MSPLLISLLLGACLALIPAGPAAADPIGSQFRVSSMGPDGNTTFSAFDPKVAYNPQADQYLVIWEGGDDTPPLVVGENEVFGRFVDAAGNPLGADFRISDMGPNGNAAFDAVDPDVTYNPVTNEYLVVWEGDDDTAPLLNDELEIFGQRIDASGAEVGPNDFRVSDLGPVANANFDAGDPAVKANAQTGEYLVAFEGEDAADGKIEIFGQRIDASGAEAGPDDFRVSDLGPDLNGAYDGGDPSVAYGEARNEYLVAWEGDDDVAPLVDNEVEVFGQRVSAAGAEVGTSDFRVSDMGPNGDTTWGAGEAVVAYNSRADQYLVGWLADDNAAGLANDELEIYGQVLDGAGAEVGTNDFRVSDVGVDGNAAFDATEVSVAYNRVANEYLVAWPADEGPPLADDEVEIYGQRLAAAGTEQGTNDFRLSAMGPDGNAAFDAGAPAVGFGSGPNEYLVAWQADDNTAPLVDNELEIFARRSAAGAPVVDPPPADPPSPAPPAETVPEQSTTPPPTPAARPRRRQLLLVGAPARQRLLKRRKLVLAARCNPTCVISIKARLRTPGRRTALGHRPLAFRLRHDARHRISLLLSRAWLKRLRRSSGRGEVIVTVTVKGIRPAPTYSAVVKGA